MDTHILSINLLDYPDDCTIVVILSNQSYLKVRAKTHQKASEMIMNKLNEKNVLVNLSDIKRIQNISHMD